MPLYSLREYIKEQSSDLKNALQEGGMSEEKISVFNIILNKHFKTKVLLGVLEQHDPHIFWEKYFDLCAYNVFQIGVELVMEKVLKISDEQ